MIKITKKKDKNRADRRQIQASEGRGPIRNKSRSSGDEESKEDSFTRMRTLLNDRRDGQGGRTQGRRAKRATREETKNGGSDKSDSG